MGSYEPNAVCHIYIILDACPGTEAEPREVTPGSCHTIDTALPTQPRPGVETGMK